ncbi:hypothetical protein K431DRAFT_236437 [Polychaeton citri CBS 116435]|uniref:CPAF-like PDZ domain-containing protein n=1 Tax=Polychaeton citri CBS 116435 TaxID=1314669 RepID=A0A9P4PY50_9PEZI|nr:hypothetical protein K431DRAFT_236437 [Polychaeton citri CBS 116435]
MRLHLAGRTAIIASFAGFHALAEDCNWSDVAHKAITSITSTLPAACATVSSSWAAQIANTPRPTVDAKFAYECINSVPLNKASALKFVDELKPYLEWQSNLAFLKDPPADYPFPAHDIFAALERVRIGLESDKYRNEYSWQQDLFIKVFAPAHDGHLYLNVDILTQVMDWARPLTLVSISDDGTSAPVIKVYDDVVSSPDTASTITHINGLDAATYIEDQVFEFTGSRDLDPGYNAMFYAKAVASFGGAGHFKEGGRTRLIYPGETTSFTFANGTHVKLPNVARLFGDWEGVVDGSTLFSKFAPGASIDDDPSLTASGISGRTGSSATHIVAPTADPTAVNGYPTPILISNDSKVSGYFINDPGFDDVAVLALRSFGPKKPAEFQAVVQDFFDTAVRAGKTKLVVDLQANGGGYVLQGYDTFRQIFPDVVQESSGRWRYSPGLAAISQIFSVSCRNYNPENASHALIQQCESVYNWRYGLDKHSTAFGSYRAKFPPTLLNGDKYSELVQRNFENPLETNNKTYGLGYDMTGYGSRKNFTRPFGGPENIVLLYDGACASTCALFSQSMKWDAGVQSIAMGGRPAVKGQIPGVGGVRGAQQYSLKSVFEYTQLAKQRSNDRSLITQLDRFTPYVLSRAPATGLNVKDQILRQNWQDGIPAQFVREHSECRLYWQADMVHDITNVWKAAATAAFKGGKCAFGSIDHTVAALSKPWAENRSLSRSPPSPASQPSHDVVDVETDGGPWAIEANQWMATEI